MGCVQLTTILSVHEHSTLLQCRKRKLAKTDKTYYLRCQSRQNICKFVANANGLLLILHLATVRCYLLLSQLAIQSQLATRAHGDDSQLLPTFPTYLAAWGRLLPDFGRIIQDMRQEEDKERRTWNNQVTFSFSYIVRQLKLKYRIQAV